MSWRKLKLAFRDAEIHRMQERMFQLAPWTSKEDRSKMSEEIEALRDGRDPQEIAAEREEENLKKHTRSLRR